MGRPHDCNCRCGCCLPAYVYGFVPDPADIPQRFQIDSAAWSWGLPDGLTQADVSGPLTPAVETQIASQEWHALTIARNLDAVGQSNVAWSHWYAKYSGAFGTFPSGSPYGTHASMGPYKWVAADDESVVQHFHPAYGVVRVTGVSYELSSVPSVCESELLGMVDDSANSSGATPFRAYDTASINSIGMGYPTCFVSDIRIGNDGYSTGWGVGDSCNVDVAWQSLAVTFGNTLTVDIFNQIPGPCYWRVTVRLRPRFSIWSNGKFTRAEYYRAGSAPVPPTLYANGYIRNNLVGVPGKQNAYSGRFGYCHPAAAKSANYGDWVFYPKGWAVPPYLITAGYGSSFEGVFGFNDSYTLRNRGGPGDDSLVASDPPGGWRSWIEVTYLSDNPINCTTDIADADSIPMHLLDDPVSVTLAPYTIAWTDWLTIMADAFGLATPPSTMTLQRLSDIT